MGSGTAACGKAPFCAASSPPTSVEHSQLTDATGCSWGGTNRWIRRRGAECARLGSSVHDDQGVFTGVVVALGCCESRDLPRKLIAHDISRPQQCNCSTPRRVYHRTARGQFMKTQEMGLMV